MYVIKMKTIIYYLAVFAIVLSSIGVISYFDTDSSTDTVEVSEEMIPQDAEQSSGTHIDSVEVPIIMYHNIRKEGDAEGKYVVSEADFEDDLEYLKKEGYETVVMQDLIDYTQGKGDLPQKPVVLTFDDGYFNNFAYAFPLLQKYDAKAVVSVIGYYTDMFTENPDENPAYSHITWGDINFMMNSGNVEFQNHSYDLHSTDKGRNGAKKKRDESSEEYEFQLTSDLQKLQDAFKVNTGYVPTTFTYPFGSVSEASFDIIKKMGFKASLSCENKTNYISRNPEDLFMLNRFIRTPDVSVEDILK